ncbi:MAG: DUF4145 domain-containing protein [Candidatus Lokiarchaeota archaeon]|nr:DUF4145 domain-containing protein [Candidatus Lokiarchaeota archaeon]
MNKKYIPPQFQQERFNCPHCQAYAHQSWYYGVKARFIGSPIQIKTETHGTIPNLDVSVCYSCRKHSLWIKEKLIYPNLSIAPYPNEDMPDDVKEDFLEARKVVQLSPRSASALLRLCVQKLMLHLGESGKNINEDIASLVREGLSVTIQQALDVLRVIGNESVHPGQLDMRDNQDVALKLFNALNLIIQDRITQPKEMQSLFDNLPDGKKKAIEKRDMKGKKPKR